MTSRLRLFQRAFALLLSCAIVGEGSARAVITSTWHNEPFVFGARETQVDIWYAFGITTGMTEFFKMRHYPVWKSVLLGSLTASIACVAEEYGNDGFPRNTDVESNLIGLTGALLVQIPLDWPKKKDKAPLVEIIQAEGRVSDPLHMPDIYDRAREEALKNAVRKTIQLYSPYLVNRDNLNVYEKTIIPEYKKYIFNYGQIGNQPICERRGEAHVAQVQAKVYGDALYKRMLEHGLKKPGEHFEFQVLTSKLKGGSGGTVSGPNGTTVENRAYSGDLLGWAGRYYFIDWIYGEVSDMMLVNAINVGYQTDASGKRTPITLWNYTPMAGTFGVKWWDRWDIKATSGLGLSYTQINAGGQQWVQSWLFGNEVQWVPTRWLGLGFRAEYRTRTHYDLVTEKMAQRWRISEELLIGF